MSTRCGIAAALCFAVGTAAAAPPKHIVMLVVDDWGWADASYKAAMYVNASVARYYPPTPNLDALAVAGVRLESTYVHPLCSPSRTALLSGRYSYTTGMVSEVIVDGVPDQLPTNIRTVADLLSAHGWATLATGKWDVGMTSWGCTPLCRGFQNFSGFFNAFNDYFTHHVGTGLDLRRDDAPDFGQAGVYETELITARVVEWINASVAARGPDAPTFAYVAQQAIHAPQQVPASYVERCVAIPEDQPIRKISCGQIVAVDDGVGAIVAAYEALGILQDTLFIATADNGPNSDTGGNAWPLRGMKATVYEGGMRAIAFASGAGLDPSVRGSVNHEIYSLVDWLPTIVHGIAGVPLSEAEVPKYAYQPAPRPLDGVDVWASISQGLPSPRTEALLQLDPLTCFNNANVPCNKPGQAAYRAGRYKLITGHVSTYAGPGNVSSLFCGPRDGVVQPNTFPLNATPATTPPFCPTGWVPPPGSGLPIVPPPEAAAQCTELPCLLPVDSPLMTGTVVALYDVVADPFETTDLAAANPTVVAQLLAKLDAYNATRIPQSHSPTDPASNPAKFGGVWTPWVGNPLPSACDPNATVPGSTLHSNFDGPMFGQPAAGDVTLQGWAWDSAAPDGGRAPLNVSFALDGEPIGWQLATVDRPGLPNKTGAPNPQHGFLWQLPAPLAQRVQTGRHTFDVLAQTQGSWVEIEHAPQCTCGGVACACSGDAGDGAPADTAASERRAAFEAWMAAHHGVD